MRLVTAAGVDGAVNIRHHAREACWMREIDVRVGARNRVHDAPERDQQIGGLLVPRIFEAEVRVRNRGVVGGEEAVIRVKELTQGGCRGVRAWMRGHLLIVGAGPGD